ncbi:hypothetical protein BBJ28_00003044 [Nothophytophthora sp. Chile5]|nr:hypothetical protein BBJ28_00003044 [Nothophytophthora sp. Chile5]
MHYRDRRHLSAAPIGVALEQVLPRMVVSATALKEVFRLYKDQKTTRAGAALCYLYGDAISPRLQKESYASTIAAMQTCYRDEQADDVALKLQPKLLLFPSAPHAAQLDFQLECAASPVLFKLSLVRNLPLLMTPLASSLARREFGTGADTRRSGYLTLDRTRKAVPLLKVDPLVLQQPSVGIWVYGVHVDDAWNEEAARRQLADPFLYFACIGYLMSETIKERVGPAKNTFLVALYPAGDASDGSAVGLLPRFFECSFSEYLSPPATPLPMELYAQRRSCLVGVSNFFTDVELTLTPSPTNEWEAARRQMKIPTAPCREAAETPEPNKFPLSVESNAGGHGDSRSFDGAESEEKEEELASIWPIQPDVASLAGAADSNGPRQELTHEEAGAARGTTHESAIGGEPQASSHGNLRDSAPAQTTEERQRLLSLNVPVDEAPHQPAHSYSNGGSHRSCCQSQQLLTIQHQQILENQQRQLHEMQEQIAQLRRLLAAARSDRNPAAADPNEDAYNSDASSSSIGAVGDVSGTFTRREVGLTSSRTSQISAPQPDRDDLDKSFDRVLGQNDEDGASDEEEDESMSSLGLSSISNKSVGSELSSLSSSIASKRLQKHEAPGDHGEASINNEADADADDSLDRSQVSQTGSSASKQTTQMIESSTVQSQTGGDSGDEDVGDSNGAQEDDAFETTSVSCRKMQADEDDADASGDDHSVVERLLAPDQYLRKVGGFVDHHGGCFTTPPLDFHSFCVPRIKFASDPSGYSLSDSDDEEIRLIEQKYKRLMAA